MHFARLQEAGRKLAIGLYLKLGKVLDRETSTMPDAHGDPNLASIKYHAEIMVPTCFSAVPVLNHSQDSLLAQCTG